MTTRIDPGSDTTDAARRKRILYRSQHRGMREMDILLGNYVAANIGIMAEADLETLERLMDVPDQDLFGWMVGRVPVPANFDTPVYRAIIDFKTNG